MDSEDIKYDFGIAQVELFDMFQVNRRKIMDWLMANDDGRNAVSYACVS